MFPFLITPHPAATRPPRGVPWAAGMIRAMPPGGPARYAALGGQRWLGPFGDEDLTAGFRPPGAGPSPTRRTTWPGRTTGLMPVILPAEPHAAWLDPDTPEEELTTMLRPYPADRMCVAEAGPAVNSLKNDGPEWLGAARTPGRS